jgi:hypothetical protein
MHRVSAVVLVLIFASASSAQPAPRRTDAAESAAGAKDKIVCKTFLRTGTLADRYRTCKTKGEWERERENLREADRAYGCRMNDAYAEPCK